MALPLSFADLTLGTTVEIPHIDSENLTIKVPLALIPAKQSPFMEEACPSMRTLPEEVQLL